MFAAISPPAQIPHATMVETRQYYEINGRHEADLVREMNAKAPLRGKDRYWGNTATSVQWTYDVKKREDKRCVITHPKVAILITTTLPRWTPPAATSKVVIAKWDKLYKALVHHEGEHGQFAKDEGDAVVALMRSHASDDSCERLRSYLDAELHKLDQKGAAQNEELDRRTHHGTDEGVAISW